MRQATNDEKKTPKRIFIKNEQHLCKQNKHKFVRNLFLKKYKKIKNKIFFVEINKRNAQSELTP